MGNSICVISYSTLYCLYCWLFYIHWSQRLVFCSMNSSFALAAVRKHHRLSCMNNGGLFVWVLEARSPWPGHQSWCLVSVLFLSCRWSPSYRGLTWLLCARMERHQEKEKVGRGVNFLCIISTYKIINPIIRVPSSHPHLNFFAKVLISKHHVKASTYESARNTNTQYKTLISPMTVSCSLKILYKYMQSAHWLN